ncbi:MAG: hypothetical protein H7Y37_11810 [Anaerolineae bacterium]|nr:hypothetical protein [Gloeobacterales cyanobacterium ES-bin-313]
MTMTETDNSIFLSRNFLEFVVSGNYLLQESIRTLAEELKEKIGIKLPQELKHFEDTEIELKQKLGLKLFQDVEQEVDDEFQNRKEHSWTGDDLQRGVSFNKTTDLKLLQICRATSLVYLGNLRLKKDLFLKEQGLAPISVLNAVEVRVHEVTDQITEKLGDVALDEIWKEVIRYHFRDHFQAVKDVLAALDQPPHAMPFFTPPEIPQVPAQTNMPAQMMSVPRPSEEEYQLYQPRIASQSVSPQRPQVVPAFALPPFINKTGNDFLAGILAYKAPILVGLTCFVGTIGFFILNQSGQNSVSTVLPTASIPTEFVRPTNNSTVIESSAMPTDARNPVNLTTSTATEKSTVIAPLGTPTQKPAVQSTTPKVASEVVPQSALTIAPSPSRHSRRRSHSRRHKSRHGSKHYARG